MGHASRARKLQREKAQSVFEGYKDTSLSVKDDIGWINETTLQVERLTLWMDRDSAHQSPSHVGCVPVRMASLELAGNYAILKDFDSVAQYLLEDFSDSLESPLHLEEGEESALLFSFCALITHALSSKSRTKASIEEAEKANLCVVRFIEPLLGKYSKQFGSLGIERLYELLLLIDLMDIVGFVELRLQSVRHSLKTNPSDF